jgi:RHS repeat-associated protein
LRGLTPFTYDYAHRRKELHTWRENPGLNQSMNTPPTSPASSVTTWNYSTTTGYLTSKRDAANKGADYEYTNAGRLWKRTWARGGTTIYTYTAGRLTNTNYPDVTPDVTNQYNRLGQPRYITQTAQSEVEYTYDANFFLDKEIVRYDLDQNGNFNDAVDQTRTLDRSVDSSGRPNGWQLVNSGTPDPIENRADYTFDSAGRLATVADGTNTFTYGYQYNQTTAADPRVGSTTGTKQDFMPYTLTKEGSAVPPVLPALQAVRTYEARRDALASVENKAGTTTRSSYTYTVNGIGQRTGLTTTFTLGGGLAGNHGSTAWTYDSLGQLKSANAPETIGSANADRYFEYDEIGNREFFRANTSTNSGGTLTEYFGELAPNNTNGANALNQYARIKRGFTTRIPAYDFDGNATSYPLPAHNSLSTLAWDAENRLTSVTVNGDTTTYRYDALSRRIAKITGSVTTLYRYDGWNCIAEYTGSTTLSEIRTWGLDLSGSGQGAGGVGGLLAEKTGGTYYYPTFDGNGNVSEYLNANGDTIAHFEYDPFGNTVVNAGSVGLFNYRFSTKPLDSETGLFYYGYRFYDPVTGRWPSRDPIQERGGVNLYGFVGSSPLSRFDLLGLVEKTRDCCIWELFLGHGMTQENPAIERIAKTDLNKLSEGDRVSMVACNYKWINAHIPLEHQIPSATKDLTESYGDGHYSIENIEELNKAIKKLNLENHPTQLNAPPTNTEADLILFSPEMMDDILNRVKAATLEDCKTSCCKSIKLKVSCSEEMRELSLWGLGQGLNGRKRLPIGENETPEDYLNRVDKFHKEAKTGICGAEITIECP